MSSNDSIKYPDILEQAHIPEDLPDTTGCPRKLKTVFQKHIKNIKSTVILMIVPAM